MPRCHDGVLSPHGINRWNRRCKCTCVEAPGVESLSFALTYPFLVGPIPFKLKITSGFAFEPAFTSKATVAQGALHQSFGGDVSLASDTSSGSSDASPNPAS